MTLAVSCVIWMNLFLLGANGMAKKQRGLDNVFIE